MTKPIGGVQTVYGESPGPPVVDGPEGPGLVRRAGTSGVELGRVVQAHDAGRVDEPERTRDVARIWMASSANAMSFDVATVVPVRRTVIIWDLSTAQAFPAATAGETTTIRPARRMPSSTVSNSPTLVPVAVLAFASDSATSGASAICVSSAPSASAALFASWTGSSEVHVTVPVSTTFTPDSRKQTRRAVRRRVREKRAIDLASDVARQAEADLVGDLGAWSPAQPR